MSEFKKTIKQRLAIDLLGSVARFIALFGGSRSGKTFIIVYAIIVRACKVKSKHAIVRLNFNAVKRTIWQDTLPKVLNLCFPELSVKWNKTDFILDFPNGSQIFILGLDDGARVEKILGLELSTLYINEASQVDYNSIQIAISRLAEKNSLSKKVYFDFNPPNKTHWSYWLFIKKIDPIDEVPLSNPDDYASLLMNPVDNLDNIDSEYIALLSKMPEKERLRFLEGEFNDESNGQVYYSFNREKHVKEFATIPGTRFIGMDFNVDPMTATIGQVYDNKFWISDEVFLENSDTYKMAEELKKKSLSGHRVIPDSTGKNRKTSGQSDFEILKSVGFIIESTHNPFVGDRVNNVNRLFLADRIMIHPRCKKLINDLEKVVWKNNDLDQHGKNKHLTHISDSLGYMLWKLEPFKASLGQIESHQR